MDAILFNMHDVTLITTVVACILAAACLFRCEANNSTYNIIVIAFFVASLSLPIDTLVSYGAAIRPWVIDHAPHLFFLFEYGSWIQAPLAYWLVRSTLHKDFRFQPLDYFLLIPFLLHVTHQTVAYHSLATETKVAIQQSLNLQSSPLTVSFFLFARDVFRCWLAWEIVKVVRGYWVHTGASALAFPGRELAWLWYFSFGFLLLNVGHLAISCLLLISAKWETPVPIAYFGLSLNYATLLFWITFIVIYSHRKNHLVPVMWYTKPRAPSEDCTSAHSCYVAELKRLMEEKKVYLDAELNLERLANQLNLSARTLSKVINRQFGCTYLELSLIHI